MGRWFSRSGFNGNILEIYGNYGDLWEIYDV
jgi:hypothetical protein